MAWKTTTRSSGASGMARRSCSSGRPKVVVDGDVDLRDKKMPHLVKKMRKGKRRRKGKERGHGVVVVRRTTSFSPAADGGMSSSISSSLGALGEGFLGQMEEEGRAIRCARCGFRLHSRECELKRGRSTGRRESSSGVGEGGDMGDPHVSGRGGKEVRAGWLAGPAQLGWLGWTFSFFL